MKQRKKQLLCGLLAAASLSFSVQAEARTVPVQIDGHLLDAVCTLSEGVTYVPLRALLEQFGGWDIFWDSEQGQAVAASPSDRLYADPDRDTLAVNGTEYPANVYVDSGRTYVPLRLTANLLGGSAVWDPRMGGAAVTSPAAVHDAVDLYWLSRIISAESGGEPIEGQIAVGNVVLNRVDSNEFPDTVPDVIFDRVDAVQFEPVENGTIYRAPQQSSVEAAERALGGENIVGEAMYFYAPALSPGHWINANRTYQQTIGCHRFYL